jgi:hypothetical protein
VPTCAPHSRTSNGVVGAILPAALASPQLATPLALSTHIAPDPDS